MEAAGLEPGAELLLRERVAAPAETSAGARRSPPARRCCTSLRLRSGGGVPLTIEDFWLPLELFPGIEELDLSGSIYALMRERYERAPVRAVERLEPVPRDGARRARARRPRRARR